MPAAMALIVALLALPTSEQPLTLEIRTYRGTRDVSEFTRVIVHRAGERDQPVATIPPGGLRSVRIMPGTYDAQAVHERDGRVLDIHWAERLIVMPYPDEGGHHLEVINFSSGYGALQIRGNGGAAPDASTYVALYPPDERVRPAAVPKTPGPYALFIVRAGRYDLLVRLGSAVRWHAGVDVPNGRTRLWILP